MIGELAFSCVARLAAPNAATEREAFHAFEAFTAIESILTCNARSGVGRP